MRSIKLACKWTFMFSTSTNALAVQHSANHSRLKYSVDSLMYWRNKDSLKTKIRLQFCLLTQQANSYQIRPVCVVIRKPKNIFCLTDTFHFFSFHSMIKCYADCIFHITSSVFSSHVIKMTIPMKLYIQHLSNGTYVLTDSNEMANNQKYWGKAE